MTTAKAMRALEDELEDGIASMTIIIMTTLKAPEIVYEIIQSILKEQ